jgi:error-prone DNA polymerase
MALSTEIPFAELAAKTNYSFLEGASHPEEMVTQAKALGYAALGTVDTYGVYGSPRAHVAAKEHGLPFVAGAEITVEGSRALLLARNRAGYGNLCELLTLTHDDRDNPRASWQQLFNYSADLFLLLPSWKLNEAMVPRVREAFGENFALLVSRYLDGSDLIRLKTAETQAHRLGVPCVASNQPLFHIPERKPLQDVLACIRHGCPLREGGLHLLPNAERYLKSPAQMRELFREYPEWIENSARIAADCRFSLDEIRYRYPTEWIPEGKTGDGYLAELVWQGAAHRYGDRLPGKVEQLLHHELALIAELQYSDYFLTIWDIVSFARSQGILCQGRGSAANSLVCFVLGITAIDPAHLDLLFERFISRERREPPDIDIDFEHERREEVIQYIYKRYGRHRAAITAEVICFRKKSALREVAKVFEIPVETIEKLQTVTHRRSLSDVPPQEIAAAADGIPPRRVAQYFHMVKAIRSFPRHLGTHVGGFVLCQDALTRNVPIEKAAMQDRTIVQWDKNDLDALGFVRVDVLGLGILTAIRKTFTYLQETRGIALDLATMPREDPKVYDAICAADTVGVFQIESRAQMNMLPRLKPRKFYDLVVEISLVRPGPIQGDMVHPYLRRRMGEEPIEYAHPLLETILKKTCGVPLFQEQIMKMAMAVAGFSAGKADELRRAMGSWRRDGGNRLTPLGESFRQGLVANGVASEYADKVFKQIEGFAEYGFPEAHAASFAVLVYATAYLKFHYPDAFLAGLLNAQPMGFYSAHTLLHDGMRHGVKIASIDVRESRWDNHLVKPMHLRLGFREIRGLRQSVAEAIEKARQNGNFTHFDDFLERTTHALRPVALTKRDLFLLAGANAFACLGWDRRQAFWNIQLLALEDSYAFNPTDEPVALPPESEWEKISGDYESQGVSLHTHPMAYFREQLRKDRVTSSADLKTRPENARVIVAGISICRQQPPTASGVLFVTLEDEWGFVNLVVWKKVFETYREPLLTQSFLVCEGRVQRAKGTQVIHVIVDKAGPLLHEQQVQPALPSHDFH